MILAGAITSVATALTGFADWLRTEKGSQVRRVANAHAITMIGLTVVVVVNLAYRYLPDGDDNATDPSAVSLVLDLAILGLVALGGTIGGSLTYDWGRQRRGVRLGNRGRHRQADHVPVSVGGNRRVERQYRRRWVEGSSMSVAVRLRDAMNAHDLEAFLACFHEDYQSEQPAHPGRGFGGRQQVRANWSTIFSGVPDFAAQLRGCCDAEGQEWSEWRWTGTRANGEALDMAGVIVAGLRDGRMIWGRLYIEPVEAVAESIDEAVSKMAGRPSQDR